MPRHVAQGSAFQNLSLRVVCLFTVLGSLLSACSGPTPVAVEVAVSEQAVVSAGLHVYVRDEAQQEVPISKPRLYVVNGGTQALLAMIP